MTTCFDYSEIKMRRPCDTAPLNYLIQIGEVNLLSRLYGRVVIPPAVQIEMLDLGAPPMVRVWVAEPPKMA
jgi:predicted nucleic acid-binding protein